MVWYSLNNGLVFFEHCFGIFFEQVFGTVFFEQWFGILNNALVLYKTVDSYSLNNGLEVFEQWFGIL